MPMTTVGGPLPKEARQGRQKQKYGQCGERLLAGCIPYRLVDSEGSPVEVLLITRRSGVGWVLPKGGWESDEDIEFAALRETVEEAGVRGELDRPVLGRFQFESNKTQFQSKTCLAHVFAMSVKEELDEWPERIHRQRRWFSLKDAYRMCKHDWMRHAIDVWIDRNKWGHPIVLNGVNNQAIEDKEQLD